MPATPRGERYIIAITGPRNAGKSSLINAMTGQEIAIVSDTPGTTTDPVAKSYELLPLGPVTLYDTAGIDDVGDLGRKRVSATRKVLWRADMAIVVVGEEGITDSIKTLVDQIISLQIPFMVVFNKADLRQPSGEDLDYCRAHGLQSIVVSSQTGENVTELKNRLVGLIPRELRAEPVLVGDLIGPGAFVVLVVPIDLAAPKGRLILPQVQTIREILDNDAVAITVKERELGECLRRLGRNPDLVVTDSQVVLKVVGDVPPEVPLTTFSTVFARYKGDIRVLRDGANEIDNLQDGDRILIGEACSHHVQADDIGRVKIPRWLRQYTGKDLTIDVFSGHDFPGDLEKYRLVIHCGSCMLTRLEMTRRINECLRRGVKITNYGIAISKLHGVLERVVGVFDKS